jgi:hypothetical protein
MVALVGSDSTDAMAEPWNWNGVEGKGYVKNGIYGREVFIIIIFLTYQ